jgi:hypothetical protein
MVKRALIAGPRLIKRLPVRGFPSGEVMQYSRYENPGAIPGSPGQVRLSELDPGISTMKKKYRV